MSATTMGESRTAASGPETHGIDYIGPSERHGKPIDLFTLWFGANTVMISVATGAFFVAQGFSFTWAVIAIIIGVGLGTFLSAFHSAQGPRLGIPQMIQSRAQFGYVGGALPMLVAMVAYILFFAANPSIAALMLQSILGTNVVLMVVIITLLSFVVALWGYDLSHKLGKVLSVGAVIAFGILTVVLIAHSGIPKPTYQNLSGGGFSIGVFLEAVALSFVYQAGYAPYISDYSRYLPEDTKPAAIAGWSYVGLAASSLWLFILGAYITMVSGFSYNTVGTVVGISAVPGTWFEYLFGLITVLILVLQGSLSLYAGGNTLLSIVSSLQSKPAPQRPSVGTRAIALIPVTVICLIASILYSGNFGTLFTDALSVILILILPWSAVNLVDFYFLRHGRYNVKEIFDPTGVYGRVNSAGMIAFIVAFLLELPFTNLGFWAGPVAKALGGGDISWLVGAVVAGGLYLLLGRSAVAREAALAGGGK